MDNGAPIVYVSTIISVIAFVEVIISSSTNPTPASESKPVAAPIITIISPTGGEQWSKGNTYTIRWNASNVNKVRISLYESGRFYESISPPEDLENTGSYKWTIPPYFKSSNYYSIMIFDLRFPNVWSESDLLEIL